MASDRPGLLVRPVASDADLAAVKGLFEEYWRAFGFASTFQNFDSELANLPGKYAPPFGRLAIARVQSEPAGCIAMRRIDATRCEVKRLYAKPEFRGQGIGRALLDWLVCEARAEGYREMLGDTLPVMSQALRLYEQIGFKTTGPYADDATPGAIYLRLVL